MCNDFFAFAPNVNGHETLKSFPLFLFCYLGTSFNIFLFYNRNIKPGILEGLRGVMLRFSLLPFTGLFPILFLLSQCIFFLSFDYYLSLTHTQQCTVCLLICSAHTHAQLAQPYCTVYKDSMDILFQQLVFNRHLFLCLFDILKPCKTIQV